MELYKKILLKVDSILFSGKLFIYYKRFRDQKVFLSDQKILSKIFNKEQYYYTVSYNKNIENTLAILCDKFGSDKGSIESEKNNSHVYEWPAHTYTDYYHSIFHHCRNDIERIFECGLGTNNTDFASNMGESGKPGASLRVWKEYFLNAEIIGADIDKGILFTEERIKTFYVDQTSESSIEEMWNAISVDDFDIILDDGLHTFESSVCLFINSIDKLKKSGIYIIEDIALHDLTKYKDYFYKLEYKIEIISFNRPSMGLFNNSLLVIRK